LRQLEEARDYLEERSPQGADVVMGRVVAALAALERHPEIGRVGRIQGTRELVIAGTPYIIAYRLAGGAIEILAFLHGARKWPDRRVPVFEEPKLRGPLPMREEIWDEIAGRHGGV